MFYYLDEEISQEMRFKKLLGDLLKKNQEFYEQWNTSFFASRKYLAAFNAGAQLHAELLKAYAQWRIDENYPYELFKNTCALAIEQARPELQTHRGMLSVLDKILSFICDFFNRNRTSTAAYLTTQSVKIINKLQQSINDEPSFIKPSDEFSALSFEQTLAQLANFYSIGLSFYENVINIDANQPQKRAN